MTINAISNTALSTATTTSATIEKDETGRDMFLQMLISQLKNQDPLNPLEGADFTAQLAQFTSLEELFKMNSNLKDIQTIEGSQNNNMITNMIGKEVEARGNATSVSSETVSNISYKLDSNAKSVDIYIYDSNGSLVRNISEGNIESGEHSISWDGKNNDGVKLANGTYSYQVSAKDSGGTNIGSSTYIKGEITSVSFNEDGSTSIWMENLGISLGDVLKISSIST